MREQKLLAEFLYKPDLPEDDLDSIISWCELNAVFSHLNESEYIFWVPSFDEHETALKVKYGEGIPEPIRNALIQAIHTRASESDAGYLLIAII